MVSFLAWPQQHRPMQRVLFANTHVGPFWNHGYGFGFGFRLHPLLWACMNSMRNIVTKQPLGQASLSWIQSQSHGLEIGPLKVGHSTYSAAIMASFSACLTFWRSSLRVLSLSFLSLLNHCRSFPSCQRPTGAFKEWPKMSTKIKNKSLFYQCVLKYLATCSCSLLKWWQDTGYGRKVFIVSLSLKVKFRTSSHNFLPCCFLSDSVRLSPFLFLIKIIL